MKHTIKLLTVAITLAAILTLTGCPGPVTPDKPCTHEHTRTEVIEKAAYNKDGLGKIICVDCEEVIDEQAKISRFVAGGYDGDIPAETENPETYRYEHNGTQVKVYVYTFTKEEELNKLDILYYSFEETDKTMELNDLLHLKPEYKDYTVAYCRYQFFPTSDSKYILTSNGRYIPWEGKLNYPIGIIIEPQTN